MADKMELEKQFHQAMVNIYNRAKAECNYQPSYFLKMVSELGGLEAAKRLLSATDAQQGFGTLQRLGRLDLTMEAHVIKPEFAELFSDAEIDEAKERLDQQGYFDNLNEKASYNNAEYREEDVDPEQIAIKNFAADTLFLKRLRDYGVPWRGVQEKIKEMLPENMNDRDTVAYNLIVEAMGEAFGKQGVDWTTEKRASKSGDGQTTWIAIRSDEK